MAGAAAPARQEVSRLARIAPRSPPSFAARGLAEARTLSRGFRRCGWTLVGGVARVAGGAGMIRGIDDFLRFGDSCVPLRVIVIVQPGGPCGRARRWLRLGVRNAAVAQLRNEHRARALSALA